MTYIDRRVISIILGARIVTPRRIPIAVVPIIVTATDQLDALVTRVVPAAIMSFRMIRTEHFVLRTRPAIASLNPKIHVERDRWNFVRPRLRFEIRVLLFDLLHVLLDLLHLLRIGLGNRAASSPSRAGYTSPRLPSRAGCTN